MTAALVALRPEAPSALDIDAQCKAAFEIVEEGIADLFAAADEEELRLRRMVAVMAGEPDAFEGYPAR